MMIATKPQKLRKVKRMLNWFAHVIRMNYKKVLEARTGKKKNGG